MTLFVFDFGGTLDTLPKPALYVANLLAKHPDADVVLCTGLDMHSIHAQAPMLCGVVMDVWHKPVDIAAKVAGLALDRLVVVDDEDSIRSMVARSLRKSTIPRIEILDPSHLPSLLE